MFYTDTRKLKFCPHGHASVKIDENGGIDLWSYSTLVISIDPHGWLVCTGLYSQTIRKHISYFMREYGNGADYTTAKRCYTTHSMYNIYTGKFVSLTDGE